MEAVAVQTYDPVFNCVLFLILGLTSVAFIANSIINFSNYKLFGKIAFIFSLVPLAGLMAYLTEYGYWTDEIVNLGKPYIQYMIGGENENNFLILSIMLNVLACITKDNPEF